jgi:hypothetical protein
MARLIKFGNYAYKFKYIGFFYFFYLHFLCSPKENEAKERAPGVPLLPACPAGPEQSRREQSRREQSRRERSRREHSRGTLLKTGGALSNSAPKEKGPQTAKGPVSARFCDARRGTMGIFPFWAFFSLPAFGMR